MPLAFQKKVSGINNRCQFLNLLSDMTGAILNSLVGATVPGGELITKPSVTISTLTEGFTEEYVNDEFLPGEALSRYDFR